MQEIFEVSDLEIIESTNKREILDWYHTSCSMMKLIFGQSKLQQCMKKKYKEFKTMFLHLLYPTLFYYFHRNQH